MLKLESTIIGWEIAFMCPESLMLSMGNCQTSRKMGATHGKGRKQLKAAGAEQLQRKGRFEMQKKSQGLKRSSSDQGIERRRQRLEVWGVEVTP